MATLQSPLARDFHGQVMNERVSIRSIDDFLLSDPNIDFAGTRQHRGS